MNGFEKRSNQKRLEILRTTFKLMNEDLDFKNITIDEISREANVGKTTIFKYFNNKDNLFKETFKYFVDEISQSARKILKEEKPFEDTLVAITENKIEHLSKINRDFYLTAMKYFTKRNNEGFTNLMNQYMNETLMLILDLFHRGKKEGKVDLKYSDEFLILYFQIIVEGLSNPMIYEKAIAYIDEWTEVIMKGVAPKK